MASTKHNSGWIDEVFYRNGFLVVFTHQNTAIIHAGVPSWVPGVMARGKSSGVQYNRHVRGQYPGQSYPADKVAQIIAEAA